MASNDNFSAVSGWKWESSRETSWVGWCLYFHLDPVAIGSKPKNTYPTIGCLSSYLRLGELCQGHTLWVRPRGNPLVCKKSLEKNSVSKTFPVTALLPRIGTTGLHFYIYSMMKSDLPLSRCSTVSLRPAQKAWGKTGIVYTRHLVITFFALTCRVPDQ